MTRYRNTIRRENPDDKLKRLFAEGAVIQMYHPGKGIRYITNTEAAIAQARKRGWEDVEYETRTVQTPYPVRAEAQHVAEPIEDLPPAIEKPKGEGYEEAPPKSSATKKIASKKAQSKAGE